MDVGRLLDTFKPLPESLISLPVAILPERNNLQKKGNLRPIHQLLESYCDGHLFHRVAHDKLSITVTKRGNLRS